MIINLNDVQAKTARGSEGVIISDNNINLSKFTGSEVVFTGKYTKGLLLTLRPQIEVTFRDAVIDNATENETIETAGTFDQVMINGSGTTKLFGKSGNVAPQMIFIKGRYSNIEICGFDSDQRRNNITGWTKSGSNCQLAGVLDVNHNLGKVWIHDMIFRNSGDESVYCNNFERGAGYAQGDVLIVENCKSFGSGRDPYQQWGFRNVTYRNCYAENAGKEADSNHWSGISQNGWCEELLVEDCEFKNMAQLIYSGAPEPGKHIYATFRNVKYDQGTHAGTRANSACYLKGPGKYTFEYCSINAPAAKYAGISMDNGAEVFLLADTNKIIAPDIDRFGTVQYFTPLPTTEKRTEEITVVETRDYTGTIIETRYYLGDQELVKP